MLVPNAVVRSKGDKKVYFGHEMARCKDYSSLHFRLPFDKVGGLAAAASIIAIFLKASVGLPRRLGRAEGCLGWNLL